MYKPNLSYFSQLSRRQQLTILGLLILFFVAIGVSFWFFTRQFSTSSDQSLVTPTPDSSTASAEDNPDLNYVSTEASVPPAGKPDKVFNILLLGQGDAGHEGASLTDAMMVVHVDTVAKKIVLISIPRDIWVSLPTSNTGTTNYKINAAYAVGGDDSKFSGKDAKYKGDLGPSNMAKYAVQQVTGLPIHYFVGMDFFDVQAAIDNLGGVDVNVPITFDDQFYPIRGRELELCDWSPEEVTAMSATMSGFTLEKQFPCRYEHLHFDKGMAHMDGETALKFTRSRHSAVGGSDFARGQRQQAIIIGVRDKILTWDSLDKIIPFFTKLKSSIRTDIDTDIIKAMIEGVVDLKPYTLTQIGLSTENVLVDGKSSAGAYILLPKAGEGNWKTTHDFIAKQL